MTRLELLALLERERICGDPAELMRERYAPQVAERVAGYSNTVAVHLPPISAEMAARNRARLASAIGADMVHEVEVPYGEAA